MCKLNTSKRLVYNTELKTKINRRLEINKTDQKELFCNCNGYSHLSLKLHCNIGMNNFKSTDKVTK